MSKDVRPAPQKPLLNPILLHKILLGWEDPTWGQSEIGELTIMTSIHELAGQLSDGATRQKMQSLAASGLAKTAGALAQARS